MDKNLISIKPFTSPCRASVRIPGSKSISNRALILSAMCDAEIHLIDLLESEDVNLMKDALRKLGIKIEQDKEKTKVVGNKGVLPIKECTINVGNAGTIARFLTCLLATQKDAKYYMDGSLAMRKRPMLELLETLQEQGCNIEYNGKHGHFPFTLHTSGLRKNKINIDAHKSSQNISGLLIQCPLISDYCEIIFREGTVSTPFIKMTLEMMRQFMNNDSFDYRFENDAVNVSNGVYTKNNFKYKIEPDATAASYFLTLPLVTGGECEIEGIHRNMLQGDTAYCDIIQEIGGEVNFTQNGVVSRSLNTRLGGCYDFVDISDTFLSLAAVSPLLNESLEIYGIEHTRKQETDRVSAMATELTKLGQAVTEKKDRLIIHPNLNKLKKIAQNGVYIDTYEDHRFAMSFAILGSFDLYNNGKPWLYIKDPYCCKKTFPGFFDTLNSTYNISHA